MKAEFGDDAPVVVGGASHLLITTLGDLLYSLSDSTHSAGAQQIQENGA